MQPMSSMQSSLLPGVTPGWNDPPSMTAPPRAPGSAGRLNRHKRLVDPSISGAGPTPAYGSPQPQGMPPAPAYGAPQAQVGMQQSQWSISGGVPQPVVPSGVPPYAGQPNQPYNPAYQSMSPYGSPQLAPSVNYNNGQPSNTAAVAGSYDAMQAVPASFASGYPPDKANEAMMSKPWSDQQQQQQQLLGTSPEGLSRRPGTTGGNIGREENHLIFEPPNMVGDRGIGGRLPTVPDPATYRPPTKAPGDVNLPAEALLQFLVKAAFRLPLAKCQGVQIKLHSLQQQIEAHALPEQLIKSLNYVVDSIDSERYEEANSFFDALQSSFPTETTGQQWVQGVKLLLSEMRRPSSRVGSAGRH